MLSWANVHDKNLAKVFFTEFLTSVPSSLEDEGEEEKEGLILLSSLKLWWWHVGGDDADNGDDNKDDPDNNVNDDNCDDNGRLIDDDACDCEEVASRQQGTTSPGGLQPSQVLIRIM